MQKMKDTQLMRRSMAAGLLATALLFLFPLLLMGDSAQQSQEPSVLPASPQPAVESAPETTPDPYASMALGDDSALTVRVLMEDGTVEEQTMGDYVWSVTAAEVPATFEPDAIRAQAVCARTFTYWRTLHPNRHGDQGADVCTSGSCCQAYIAHGDALARWGALAEEYAAAITEAVTDTAGIVALYEGAPIQAVFFSSSNEQTEDAAVVWGGSLPYLVSVDSPEGEEVPNYHSTVTYTVQEVQQLAAASLPDADLSGPPSEWFGDVTLSGSGRVATLTLGGVELTGSAARNLFSLRSACFSVEYGEDGFTFHVTGYGHGVGLSQYGANALAKSGSSWQQILLHYYTGVTLSTAW